MQKLKLSLDSLQVESFHAEGARGARGTVAGHGYTEYADESCFGTCNADCTRWGTCDGTCAGSCNGSCANTCGGSTCVITCVCSANATECGCETWETCAGAHLCA